MSQISDAYGALVTRLGTLYPSASGWFRLKNPYKPEENMAAHLRQGWGLAMGAANNTNRFVNCKFSIDRSFTVILAREYFAREDDVAAKAATELLLFEDQYALVNDFEQDMTINGQSMYTRYVDDAGIEYVQAGTDRFLMIRTQMALEYIENFA